MDTLLMVIELETLKKKMDNAEAFLEELIHYIFVVCKEDDYITPEVICRKLYKYGFIDKKDGEWVADTPQTDCGEKMQTVVSTFDSENAKYSYDTNCSEKPNN